MIERTIIPEGVCIEGNIFELLDGLHYHKVIKILFKTPEEEQQHKDINMSISAKIFNKFNQVYGGIGDPTNKLVISQTPDGEFQFKTPDGSLC